MAIIKRNIWYLFYLLLILGVILLGAITYNLKNNIYNVNKSEQESFVRVNATAISSTFMQYEMLLDILGDELINEEVYKSFDKTQEKFDQLLKLQSPLAAIGLVDPNGKIYVGSSNLKEIDNLKNLLEKEDTKDSFQKSLDSHSMVIGRTYYHKTIFDLIIPIRKAIRNENGEVVAVIAAGVKVSQVFDLPKTTRIFRDLDFYNQLISDTSDLKKYMTPIPKQLMNRVFKRVENKYKEPIEAIKDRETVFTIEYKTYFNNEETISTAQFIKRYGLWVVEEKPKKEVMREVYLSFAGYVFIFAILYGGLYYIFRLMDRAEKAQRKALYRQATHDYLTNLHNPFFLSEQFANLAQKRSARFSLLFIDMDNFKNVNDNYGHEYGDLILKEISRRLTQLKLKSDVLVRYSGDEFILITYDKSKDEVSLLAQKLIYTLAQPYHVKDKEFVLGASIGISRYPEHAKNIEDLKRFADIAMYEAKKDKNRAVLFEESIKNRYLRTSMIENELKTAIENDEIYMVYQPQISQDGSLYGVEALIRWENESLGFVPPDEFIHVAETSGLMTKLGKFIIQRSCEDMKAIQEQTGKEIQLSINISVKQFMEVNFFESLMAQIKRLKFNHQHLTLEVTESVFIEDMQFILNLLQQIKEQGIRISLDDFGTGYSSLSLLKKLPIDELKIDKSFIDDILVDKDSLNMVETIISIGKKFSLELVAEGIENQEQKEKLDSLSCDLYQGYYFSRPLKKEDLIRFIKE